jgi:hypothetical protein
MKGRKKDCKHINRRNIDSWYIKDGENSVTVECVDCKQYRYERRTKGGGKSEGVWRTKR